MDETQTSVKQSSSSFEDSKTTSAEQMRNGISANTHIANMKRWMTTCSEKISVSFLAKFYEIKKMLRDINQLYCIFTVL